MKCPHKDIQCDSLDSAGTDVLSECSNCKHYPDPAQKLMNAFPLEQMINMLPKTIIREKKKIFRYSEIFDLHISRDAMDNWVFIYQNDRNLTLLFISSDPSIHRSCALILAKLIENKYLPA
jgi:hypothetical protein